MNFKYFFSLLTLFCLLFSLGGCRKHQLSREESIIEFRNSLSSSDTTTMLKLCDDAMEMLKARNIDGVIANLWEYNDSTKEVYRVSEKTEKRFRRSLSVFPVLDYHREYFSFMLEGCNDVRYKITFAPKEQTGTEQPATTSFMFNPVKIDGEWRLCVKTPDDAIDSLRI